MSRTSIIIQDRCFYLAIQCNILLSPEEYQSPRHQGREHYRWQTIEYSTDWFWTGVFHKWSYGAATRKSWHSYPYATRNAWIKVIMFHDISIKSWWSSPLSYVFEFCWNLNDNIFGRIIFFFSNNFFFLLIQFIDSFLPLSPYFNPSVIYFVTGLYNNDISFNRKSDQYFRIARFKH